MQNIDKFCTDIIREFTDNKSYAFEKISSEEVKVSKEAFKLPEGLDLQKIASEIRNAAAPVELTYDDVNTFIDGVLK